MNDREPTETASAGGLTTERVNALVQTVAIIAAGAWGIYTFIYEARIKPSLEAPAVSVTAGLVKAGERDGHVAIRSTMTRKNVGQTPVRILGLVYNVIGVQARFRDQTEATATAEPLGGKEHVAQAAGYTLGEPGTVLLRQGTLFAGAADAAAKPSDLAPGEAVSRDLIVYVDAKRSDFVRFEVSLAYAKEDEPPVKLRFDETEHGALTLVPQADCRADPAPCQRLKTTDFTVEFSLW